MKTRKMTLLALIAVLLCVYVVQLIQAGRSPIKEFVLKEDADELEFASAANGTVLLHKAADGWTIGEQAYIADSDLVGDIAKSAASVRTLGTVSHSSSEETAQRFGLDDGNVITVTVRKDGKTLRTLQIGKAATTGDQTYIRVDGKSDIFMASGTLRDTFGKAGEDLRDKHIYSFNTSDVTAVHVDGEKGAFTATKAFGSEGAVWSLADTAAVGADLASAEPASDEDAADAEAEKAPAADSGKIASWVTQVSSLDAQSFADDSVSFPEAVMGSIEISAGTNRATVTVAKIAGESADGSADRYLCKASGCKYLFYISKANAERLLKNPQDFNK